ncbi:MAG TPA: multicopper oxidase domain-containing protein [Candidatus Acidoferrum sp.]|nr:multicopper oxidase domain-containing protein [Candidatus Acidoferrum sp.]
MRILLSTIVLLATIFVALPADTQQALPNCAPGRPLLKVPEITRTAGSPGQPGRLRGTIVLTDEQRSLAGGTGGTPCNYPQLRYFKGLDTTPPWTSTGDPLPGPTLRARVGDLVQIAFLNQVDVSKFPNTLDQDLQGKTPGCDEARAQRSKKENQGQSVLIYPRNDSFPDCLHGSSTANLHFHGTHTTPSTTGDNVLLYIRPALREGGKLEPSDDFVKKQFADFFEWCDANGSPTKWEQIPADWRNKQEELLNLYDKTAPYKGERGKLPENMQLWPVNKDQIARGVWPQYSIGGFPHCFRLPAYDPAKVKMGQSPGTHWYHAHKHGSTALNVGNGMTGAFIIEGEYDDALRDYYKATPQHQNWGLEEHVLVIQQLSSGLNLLSAANIGNPAPLSVNGRLAPVVTMRPNQVALWRIVNSNQRSFVQFRGDAPQHNKNTKARVSWRQTAQDGVQFAPQNYTLVGAPNNSFNLAAANRADVLVQAPDAEGDYNIPIMATVNDLPDTDPSPITTLLTVRVRRDSARTIDPPMPFMDEKDFPKLPPFLKDIEELIVVERHLRFDTKPFSDRSHVSKAQVPPKGMMPVHQINDKLYSDQVVDQTMFLDTVEAWKISNKTDNIAHPFHIHINPFQIVELFQPNSKEAMDPNGPCYADPTKPETWRACGPLPQPWVWWDTFSIPTSRQEVLPCQKVEECEPAAIRPHVACMNFPVPKPDRSGVDIKFQCRLTIPGYFKFKSRFVDFTGQYVIHCHILAHEDRGMMELVQVIPKPKSPYTHH